MGPLHGIKVIDMTSVLMGPFASQSLGDMGADVVKIEAPLGDLVRVRAVARGQGLAADVTVQSVAALELATGQEVTFTVKATEVAVYLLSQP